MANEAYSDFTALATLASGDLMPATDISDTTDSANGTTKKITVSVLDSYLSSYEIQPVMAGAMIPRTTNGAAAATVELATNDVMLNVYDFDTATSEGVGFWTSFNGAWTGGTVKVKFLWTAASGSGTVKFDIAGQCYADSAALDQALGTAVGATDTLITANDMHISAATAAVTVADAAAGQPVYFQITRDVATDTLAVDARLIGCLIQWKKSSLVQASW